MSDDSSGEEEGNSLCEKCRWKDLLSGFGLIIGRVEALDNDAVLRVEKREFVASYDKKIGRIRRDKKTGKVIKKVPFEEIDRVFDDVGIDLAWEMRNCENCIYDKAYPHGLEYGKRERRLAV